MKIVGYSSEKTISLWISLCLVSAIPLIAFFSIRQRHEMIRIGYEIEELNKTKVELRRMHKELLAEAESLNAMGRIDKIATEQLKMIPARPEQRVYFIEPEGSSTGAQE